MIELACATDDAYAPHCGTMLHSALARRAHAGTRVHVLHADLSGENRERLEQVVERAGSTLNWLRIDATALAGFPSQQFHIACWYRVLLPQLLPGVPRVLYVDSDTIVLDDLAALWDQPLDGRLFGAVVNPLYPFMPDRARLLGLGGPADYLNSGVLLLDLDRMRAAGITDRLRAYAGEHPSNAYPEQDALSVVCRGQWLALHPRWNVQTTLYDLSAARLPMPQREVAEALSKPAIVHFIGPLKPWHFLCRHPLRTEYENHRRQTPWPEFEPEGRTLVNRLLRPFDLGTQLRLRRLIRGIRA